MKKRGKKIFITILCVIIGIVLLLSCLRKLYTGKNEIAQTYTARKENYENVIEISGTVKAAQEQTLHTFSSGTVTKVYVKAGDYVKKGDIILQLDDTEQFYNFTAK